MNSYSTTAFIQSDVHGYVVGWPYANSNLLKAVAMAEAGCSRHPQRQCIVSYKTTYILGHGNFGQDGGFKGRL